MRHRQPEVSMQQQEIRQKWITSAEPQTNKKLTLKTCQVSALHSETIPSFLSAFHL